MKTRQILLSAFFLIVSASCPALAGSGSHGAPLPPQRYTDPIDQCVQCMPNDQGWNGVPCCGLDFQLNCEARRGVIRFRDLHPAYTILRACFPKTPDAGQACSGPVDCLSKACTLEHGIQSGACRQISKTYTDRDRNFYVAVYDCNTPAPGACEEAPYDVRNPGGISHIFEMHGDQLIEERKEGPIF